MLEYDEIGKLVEVYSPTFKTLKETYSDKKDASKDVAKLKSQLSDKSASILDAADQMNGMTDQMKDLIGMLPTAPDDICPVSLQFRASGLSGGAGTFNG